MTLKTSSQKKPRRIPRIILPLLIIAIGILVAVYFKKTAPTIKRTPPKKTVPSVDIIKAEKKDAKQIIEVMGTVIPSRKISLRSRVSGEVLFVSPNFLPGGHITAGDILVKIDPTDYDVEVEKAQSALDTKKAALLLEQGNQSVAREEMRLISETSNEAIEETDLALRKPQLQQAEAAVASAEADLKKAKLNLERTIVRAPFNALITERNVNLGAHVSAQDTLAVLAGTDEFWIEAAVPLNRLSAVKTGKKDGSIAVIRSQGSSGHWNGRVLHTTGSLSEKSRMAKMIIRVSDPLGLQSDSNRMPLMLDDYVTVEIEGRAIQNVFELPRTALRDENTLWVFNGETLSIRDVDILWKQEELIFLRDGIDEGDAIIISNISTPVDGMRLSLRVLPQPDNAAADPARHEGSE